jgi:formylglycine-generating enzyme required for sulfatase activity
LSIEVSIREPLGQRRAMLPLVIGGPGSDLPVPGNALQLRIEADGPQWLLRAIGQATVVVNGSVMRSPAPLVDFDVIRAGDAQLVVHPAAARIEVAHLAGNATVAPVQRHALPGEEVEAGVHEIIAAGGDAAAMNATSPLPSRGGSWLRRTVIAASVLLVVAVAWILFSLVPVAVQLTPSAATASVPGLLDWHAGDRVFLMPGQRTVTFSHPGYHSQRVTLEVTRELSAAAALPVTLDLLPGLLTVNTQGEPAELLVDGVAVAPVPGEVEVAAGTREIIVRAPRRVDSVSRIEIEGGGRRQTLDVQLQPATGWLVLDTLPAAASVSIDGKTLGNAPQKLELDSGLHKLAITAAGWRSWNSEIAIIAGQTLDLGRIDLKLPAPAMMRAPAMVADADADVGDVAAAGSAQPVPPPPPPPPPARLQSALLGTLVLLPAGNYQQGSDRREQGRRANEVQRAVTLTRPFYLAETEVSNAQFRVFRPNHAAGIAMDKSLDLDKQAVSNVSWDDAIEFCNWLSLREGLAPAYERRDGRWQLVQKLTSGYRLPTEAEWEYAARFVNGQRWQRYAWGDTLPPPAGAANLAGQESLPTRPGPEVRLAAALPAYSDEHPVIAPVDSYGRSPAGFLNLGGNVSEWMHDVYATLPEAGPVTDPTGSQADGPHSIRGASWRTATIAELRLAWRERAAGPAQTIGFRVARFAEIDP